MSLPSVLPPPPRVTEISRGVYQSSFPMSAEASKLVMQRTKSQTDFHKTLGTFTSFRDGTFFVQGKDSESVRYIASDVYDALASLPAPGPPPSAMFSQHPGSAVPTAHHTDLPMPQHQPYHQQPMHTQPMSSSPAARSVVKLPMEKHLMHFLVHCRGDLVEKIKEKFVGIEVHGFLSGSDCLEFIGMDCEAAMEFTKQRYKGYQYEEATCNSHLLDPLAHAAREHGAAIYAPDVRVTGPPHLAAITICGLNKEPIERVKEMMASPREMVVPIDTSFHAALRAHPTCSLLVLRNEHHIAYNSDRQAGNVTFQGFISADINSAASKLRDFVISQEALQEPKTVPLKCKDIAMRFLNSALNIRQDENAMKLIEDIQDKYSVTVTTESAKILITGLPSKIEGAQKEILEGPLLGSFKSRRAVIKNIKKGNMKLIKRCCLDDLQDKFNVLCFMHFEATAGGGGASRRETSTSDDTSGGRSKRTAAAVKNAGSIVVEVCGNVEEDVKQAHGKLKDVSVHNKVFKLTDDAEYEVVNRLQRTGKLTEIQDKTELVLIRNSESGRKFLFCNALSEQLAASKMAEVKTLVADEKPEVILVPLTPVQHLFLEEKRTDWLEDVMSKHEVKPELGGDSLSISGSRGKPQEAKRQVEQMFDDCRGATVTHDVSRHRRLGRHFYARYDAVKTDLEESYDLVVLLPSRDVFWAINPQKDHDKGSGRGHNPRGRGRGRGRGGRGSMGNDDASGASEVTTSLTVQCLGAKGGEVAEAEKQLRDIESSIYHVRLDITTNGGSKVIEAIKSKGIQPHLYRADIFIKGTVAHVTAMTQEEAEQARDVVQSFLSSELSLQDQYHFPSVIVGYLAVTTQFAQLRQLAKKNSVHFSQVKTDNRKDRPGSQGLTINGCQAAVNRFKDDLNTFVATISSSVTSGTVEADGLASTALGDLKREIQVVERECNVLCSWNDSAARPVLGHGEDGDNDNDNDDDDDDNDDATSGLFSTSRSFRKSAIGMGSSQTTTSSQWQWKDDHGWVAYDSDVGARLDNAKSYNGRVRIAVAGTGYLIDTANCKQTNESTGFVREVRCLPPHAAPAPVQYKWQFQNEQKVFEDYGADHNALLETAYAGGQKCAKFTHRQFIYTADFVKLEQCNVSTQVARPMRRVTVTSAIAHSPLASAIPVPMPRAKGIPLRYCPVDSGLVPASVTIEVQGTAAYVNAACDKLKALLQKSITDKKVTVDCEFTANFSHDMKKISAKHLVHIVMQTAGPSGSQVNAIVITGARRRVQQSERLVQTKVIQLLSEVAKAGMAQKSSSSECALPVEWTPQQDDLELKMIGRFSQEFSDIDSRIRQTLPEAKIVKIERIQNRFLWKKYMQAKDSIAEKTGAANPPELLLFHGTRNNPPGKIYCNEEGFDMRLSADGMWGRANYFAVDAKYSNSYSHRPTEMVDSVPVRQMLLAKVIVGESVDLPSNSSLRMPPEKPGTASNVLGVVRYDTVNGLTGGHRVYMVYRNSQAYPFYLLTYTVQ